MLLLLLFLLLLLLLFSVRGFIKYKELIILYLIIFYYLIELFIRWLYHLINNLLCHFFNI